MIPFSTLRMTGDPGALFVSAAGFLARTGGYFRVPVAAPPDPMLIDATVIHVVEHDHAAPLAPPLLAAELEALFDLHRTGAGKTNASPGRLAGLRSLLGDVGRCPARLALEGAAESFLAGVADASRAYGLPLQTAVDQAVASGIFVGFDASEIHAAITNAYDAGLTVWDAYGAAMDAAETYRDQQARRAEQAAAKAAIVAATPQTRGTDDGYCIIEIKKGADVPVSMELAPTDWLSLLPVASGFGYRMVAHRDGYVVRARRGLWAALPIQGEVLGKGCRLLGDGETIDQVPAEWEGAQTGEPRQLRAIILSQLTHAGRPMTAADYPEPGSAESRARVENAKEILEANRHGIPDAEERRLIIQTLVREPNVRIAPAALLDALYGHLVASHVASEAQRCAAIQADFRATYNIGGGFPRYISVTHDVAPDPVHKWTPEPYKGWSEAELAAQIADAVSGREAWVNADKVTLPAVPSGIFGAIKSLFLGTADESAEAAFEAEVTRLTEGRDALTGAELTDALAAAGVFPAKPDWRHHSRLGDKMAARGWEKKDRKIDGKNHKAWVRLQAAAS